MGNTSTSSSQAPDHILPPDYLLPCNLGPADVVFAPIGRLGAGRVITQLAYDTENRIIAAGTSSGLVILISDKDLHTTLRPPGGYAVEQLSFLNGNRLLVCNGDAIEIWNWALGSVLLQIEIFVACFVIYENRFVVFGTDAGRIEVLDIDNGRLSAYIIHPAMPEDRPRFTLSEPVASQIKRRRGYKAEINSLEVVSLALNSDELYAAYSNSTIRVYDLKAQKDKSWLNSPDVISLLSIEPSSSDRRDPPRVASAGDAGRVILWNQNQSSPLGYLKPSGSDEGIEPICQMDWIDSDRMVVLSGATSQTLTIFSLVDCSELSSFHCNMHQFLLISPMTFLSSSWEGELYISQFDPSIRRCTLIPSDFAQCVLFEVFSDIDSLEGWISALTAPQDPDPDQLSSQYLQGGIVPETALAHNLLITVSDKWVISFWDSKSPFSVKFLSDLDIAAIYKNNFANGDDFADVSCIAICSDSNYQIAVGFSNGCVLVLEHSLEQQGTRFIAVSHVRVHSRPVTLLKLCSKWDRVASADQHSVSLCELHSGQILFAIQLQQASCLFFCQIDNTTQNPGEPLRNVLLIGNKKRLLFAYDAMSGSCINSEFAPVIDGSPNDVLQSDEGSNFDHPDPPSPSSFLFNDAVIICGLVDSHGCVIPIQSNSASKSIYISPRYLIGSWNASLRVCELVTSSSGVKINSLCEIRYTHRIIKCWLISIDLHCESSKSSAIVTIDSGRRLQIRRLLDINHVLLESDIPNDLRSEDIPSCSCTEDGRLSWITIEGEIMTALLFMDGLRKIQAPMVAPIDRENQSGNRRNSIGFLSSIAKVIKRSSVAELFSEGRIAHETLPESRIETETNPISEMTSKARDNLEKVKETAEKSERLTSAAADFVANAKLLAESQKRGWF